MENVAQVLVNLPTETINVEDIRYLPNALRHHEVTDDHIIELAEDIAQHGMTDKISVCKRYDDVLDTYFYVCVNGARRSTAAKLLKEQGRFDGQLEVSVMEDISDIDIIAIQVATNSNMKETANTDYVKSLFKIQVEKGFRTTKELAEYVGKNPAWISKLMKTMKLPQEAKQAIDDGTLSSLTNASNFGKAIKDGLEPALYAEALESACNDTIEVCAAKLEDLVTASKAKQDSQKKKGGNNSVVEAPVFIPKPVFRKKGYCEELLTSVTADYEEDSSEYNKGRLDIINLIFSLDEESLSEAQVKFQETLDKFNAKKEKNEAKVKKNAAKNIEQLKTLKFKVVDEDGNEVDPTTLVPAEAETEEA